MPILIMWDVHYSGMGRYLHMTQVGFEDTEVSSLGLSRPLLEVP